MHTCSGIHTEHTSFASMPVIMCGSKWQKAGHLQFNDRSCKAASADWTRPMWRIQWGYGGTEGLGCISHFKLMENLVAGMNKVSFSPLETVKCVQKWGRIERQEILRRLEKRNESAIPQGLVYVSCWQRVKNFDWPWQRCPHRDHPPFLRDSSITRAETAHQLCLRPQFIPKSLCHWF